MEEDNLDPVELKKKILMPHLEFVKMMLTKIEDTHLEQEEWKEIHEFMISDETPSFDNIKEMENKLLLLKNQPVLQHNEKDDSETDETKMESSMKRQRSESPIDNTVQSNDPPKITFENSNETTNEEEDSCDLKINTPSTSNATHPLELGDAIKKIQFYKIPKKISTENSEAETATAKSQALSDAIRKIESLNILKPRTDKSITIQNEEISNLKPDENTFIDEHYSIEAVGEQIENQSDDMFSEDDDFEAIESDEFEPLSDIESKSSSDSYQQFTDTDQLIIQESDEFGAIESDDFDFSKVIEPQKLKIAILEKHENESNDSESNDNSKTLNSVEPSETVSISNLLENEEDNPEKLLKGLINVLGSEKLKKIQELLLKNSIESSNLENKTKENQNTNSEDKLDIMQQDDAAVSKEKCEREIVENTIDDNESNITSANDEYLSKHETIPEKIDNIPSTASGKQIKELTSLPPKQQKKKARKKMSELDLLHRDILYGHDYEGIIRACTQPRIITKTKHFEISPPKTIKNFDTVPFSIILSRLDVTEDDMPIKVNDDFYKNNSITITEPVYSRPGPRCKKLMYPEKFILNLKKEVKIEKDLIISEKVSDMSIDLGSVHSEKLVLHKKKTAVFKNKKTGEFLKKKKRKSLLWSKGILKKRVKRIQVLRVSEWEDVESSDDDTSFVTAMKMDKFKGIFDQFATKCKFEKTKKRKMMVQSKVLETDNSIETFKKLPGNVFNKISATTEIFDSKFKLGETVKVEDKKVPISNLVQKNKFKIINIPKRINLPLDKNILTMISKSCKFTENIASSTVKQEPNSKTTDANSLPNTEQTMAVTTKNQSLLGKEGKSPTKPQKVLIVKPTSREMPENIVVRSLSVQEQNELKAALSGNKPSLSVTMNNVGNINKLTSSATLSINKISSQRNVQQQIEKPSQESIAKKVPLISNVVSYNQKPAPSKSITLTEAINTTKLFAQEINIMKTPVPKIHNLVDAIHNNRKQVTSTSSNLNSSVTNSTDTIHKKIYCPEPKKIKLMSSSDDVEEIITISPKVEVVDLIDDEDDVVDVMRPWIEKSEFKSRKHENECRRMLGSTHCLAALFKCMGSTCSFYTNDKALFFRHLVLHRDHQPEDAPNFLLCCYCNFRPNSISLLATHLETAHGYGKFGCKYCFYRSVNEYQVTANHHTNFHRSKEKCVIQFEPKKIKNEITEKNFISETIPKVCPALSCPYCRIGIYTMDEFEVHVRNHKETYTTICSKCDQTTNNRNILQHLTKCFTKFGKFQCVFCVFGTSNFAAIDNHLALNHPDKMSYFAERTLNFGKEPTSMEALTIKELSKKITGNVKKIFLRYKFEDEVYRNSENFGKLSEELSFRPKIGENGTYIRVIKRLVTTAAIEPKSSLQIGEVKSLHD